MKSLLSISKKGQLGTIQSVVMTIMIIGIVLGVGLLVLEEFSDTLGDTTTTVTAEVVTLADLPGGVYVAYNHTTEGVHCYNSFAVSSVVNYSGSVTIGSGNYSYESGTGKMWNLTSEYPLNKFNVTYTYKSSSSSACEGLDTTVDAVQTIPVWLTIIIILFLVGILLAIVFKVMPQPGEDSGYSSSSSGGSFSGFSGFKGFGRGSDSVAEI